MCRGKELENKFVNELNNRYYAELNMNLKRFLTFIFNDKSQIQCKKVVGQQKADFFIKVGNEVKYVSLKSGSQNSVHVERIDKFVAFLLQEGIKKEIIEKLLLYHYGDDTIVGNGKHRYSADEENRYIKTKFKLLINILMSQVF